MKAFLLIFAAVFSFSIWAQSQDQSQTDAGADRKPAAAATDQRQYPGGADEENLTVQNQLPNAQLNLTRWSIDQKIYKELFKKKLKTQDPESANQ